MRQIVLAVSNGVCRSGLSVEIQREGWRCEDSLTTRHQLLQHMNTPGDKIVVIDCQFCPCGSKSLIRAIKRIRPRTKILFWSFMLAEAVDHYLGEEEIDGFVHQYAEVIEWLSACSNLHRDRNYVSPALSSLFRRMRDADEEQPLLRGLSKRERQVLQLICCGDTVANIAERLYISRKTVNTFRYRLFKKTGASSDVQLTHIAISAGLVPLTPVLTEPAQEPIVA
jgi:two-component system invasion response regulator UvrY